MTFRYLWRAALALVAVLLFFELAIRGFALRRHRNEAIPNADFGYVLAAGSTVRWGSEGFGVTRYVADGEIATPHSGGPNIVVLGDSHTEAFQVNDTQSFVSVAEELLWKRGLRFDLRNLGRSALTIADYVWAARALQSRYRPSAFVFQVAVADFDEPFSTWRTNHFVVRGDRTIELVHATPVSKSVATRAKLSSAILDYAADRTRSPTPRGEVPPATKIAGGPVAAQAALLHEALGGIPAILLFLSRAPHQYPPGDPGNEVPATLRKWPWVVIDTAPAYLDLRRRGRDARVFLNGTPGWGHLNAEGHAIAGRLLADEIERLLR